MGTFRLAEHFVSINGEGRRAGELALFLRFTGCNLRCDWCDTMWANDKDAPYTLMDTASLVEIANQAYEKYGVRNLPTLIAVDENYNVIDRLTGAKSATELTTWYNNLQNG